jgi:hypothetical protein
VSASERHSVVLQRHLAVILKRRLSSEQAMSFGFGPTPSTEWSTLAQLGCRSLLDYDSRWGTELKRWTKSKFVLGRSAGLLR